MIVAGAMTLAAAWALPRSAAAREAPLLPAAQIAQARPGESGAAPLREVTEARDGRPFREVFAGRVPGRAVAVVPFAELGDPRGRSAAQIRGMIEQQLGTALPAEVLGDAELRRQALAAYENFGGALVRDLPDGRQVCVALVGRPFETEEQFVAAVAAGLPAGAPVNRDFHVSEAGIQRFLAYHEIGGHCADPRMTPATGIDVTAHDGYEHNLAELRADIFATLAMARDDGDTVVARTMLELRRSYSLQATAAPFCNSPVNYGAVYRTAPGISAAMRWAVGALAIPAGQPGALRDMSVTDLLEEADRIRDEAKTSYEAFRAFADRANRLRQVVDTAAPLDLAAQALRSGMFEVQDRAWLDAGVAAIRRIFAADTGHAVALRVRCPPAPRITTESERQPPPADGGGVMPMLGAGLGG